MSLRAEKSSTARTVEEVLNELSLKEEAEFKEISRKVEYYNTKLRQIHGLSHATQERLYLLYENLTNLALEEADTELWQMNAEFSSLPTAQQETAHPLKLAQLIVLDKALDTFLAEVTRVVGAALTSVERQPYLTEYPALLRMFFTGTLHIRSRGLSLFELYSGEASVEHAAIFLLDIRTRLQPQDLSATVDIFPLRTEVLKMHSDLVLQGVESLVITPKFRQTLSTVLHRRKNTVTASDVIKAAERLKQNTYQLQKQFRQAVLENSFEGSKVRSIMQEKIQELQPADLLVVLGLELPGEIQTFYQDLLALLDAKLPAEEHQVLALCEEMMYEYVTTTQCGLETSDILSKLAQDQILVQFRTETSIEEFVDFVRQEIGFLLGNTRDRRWVLEKHEETEFFVAPTRIEVSVTKKRELEFCLHFFAPDTQVTSIRVFIIAPKDTSKQVQISWNLLEPFAMSPELETLYSFVQQQMEITLIRLHEMIAAELAEKQRSKGTRKQVVEPTPPRRFPRFHVVSEFPSQKRRHQAQVGEPSRSEAQPGAAEDTSLVSVLLFSDAEFEAACRAGGLTRTTQQQLVLTRLRRLQQYPQLFHPAQLELIQFEGKPAYKCLAGSQHRALVIKDEEGSAPGKAAYRLVKVGDRKSIY